MRLVLMVTCAGHQTRFDYLYICTEICIYGGKSYKRER